MQEPLNIRLGSSENPLAMSFSDIAIEANKRNISIPDLFAIPEKDGQIYSTGEAWVCSSFVAAIWKAGGLFDGLEVNAIEFHPRDIYQIKFFDESRVPDECKVEKEFGWCQMFGDRVMEFNMFNSVEPYSGMNESCGSVPPEYYRVWHC